MRNLLAHQRVEAEPEVESEPVVAVGEVEPGEFRDPLEPVVERCAMEVEGVRGARGRTSVVEVGGEGFGEAARRVLREEGTQGPGQQRGSQAVRWEQRQGRQRAEFLPV